MTKGKPLNAPASALQADGKCSQSVNAHVQNRRCKKKNACLGPERSNTPATRKNAAEAHKSQLEELRKDNNSKLIANLFLLLSTAGIM